MLICGGYTTKVEPPAPFFFAKVKQFENQVVSPKNNLKNVWSKVKNDYLYTVNKKPHKQRRAIKKEDLKAAIKANFENNEFATAM